MVHKFDDVSVWHSTKMINGKQGYTKMQHDKLLYTIKWYGFLLIK